MYNGSEKTSTRTLALTEDEALSLLEICLYSRADDDAVKMRVMHKVGDLCRRFIKTCDQNGLTLSAFSDPTANEVLDATKQDGLVSGKVCA